MVALSAGNLSAEGDVNVEKSFICDFTGVNASAKRPKPIVTPWKRTDVEAGTLPTKPSGFKFRWYHLPVNDTESVKSCMAGISKDTYGLDENIRSVLESYWLGKLRPPASIPEWKRPIHSRSMEPSCKKHSVLGDARDSNCPLISFYLPYLNWETYERYKNKPKKLPKSRHHRRTLDQFYYSALSDTSIRDAGQTVSRWTGEANPGEADWNLGNRGATDKSLLVMVDQLWLWVLNDESILSFFPSDTRQYRGIDTNHSPGEPASCTARDDSGDPINNAAPVTSAKRPFKDLYNSIVDHESFQQCNDVYDLSALIIKQSVTVIFEHENKKFADLLGIYQWAIVDKTAKHTKCLEAFGRSQGYRRPESWRDFHSDLESRDSDLDLRQPNDRRILSLTLEMADILDELNMLSVLMDSQREVLESVHNLVQSVNPHGSRDNQDGTLTFTEPKDGVIAGCLTVEAKWELQETSDKAQELKTDAERTHRMLLDLLDLQSKAASLDEARSSTTQGRAVMLFTIVTIIFLPLSFFTSYFGQNVSELTGDEKNPTAAELWKTGGAISVVVIVGALLIAFYIIKRRNWSQFLDPFLWFAVAKLLTSLVK